MLYGRGVTTCWAELSQSNRERDGQRTSISPSIFDRCMMGFPSPQSIKDPRDNDRGVDTRGRAGFKSGPANGVRYLKIGESRLRGKVQRQVYSLDSSNLLTPINITYRPSGGSIRVAQRPNVRFVVDDSTQGRLSRRAREKPSFFQTDVDYDVQTITLHRCLGEYPFRIEVLHYVRIPSYHNSTCKPNPVNNARKANVIAHSVQ